MPCRNNTLIVFGPQAEPFGEEPSLLHLADLSLEGNLLFKQLTILPSLAFKAVLVLGEGLWDFEGLRSLLTHHVISKVGFSPPEACLPRGGNLIWQGNRLYWFIPDALPCLG